MQWRELEPTTFHMQATTPATNNGELARVAHARKSLRVLPLCATNSRTRSPSTKAKFTNPLQDNPLKEALLERSCWTKNNLETH